MKTTATEKIFEVPTDFSNRSFNLMAMFALGTPRGTNIASRPKTFGDDFLHVACKKCCLPKQVIFEEVEEGTSASFLSLIETNNPFGVRTTIKLVGYMRSLQRCGKEGFLSVDGTKSHFICRSQRKGESEVLKVVSLSFIGGSWIIEESDFTGESHVFEGLCRVYFSIR